MPAGSHVAGRRRPLVGIVAVLLVCLVVLVLGVRHVVAQPFRIPSGSMEPTLQIGDVVLADRSSRGEAVRGTIVVFDGSGLFPEQEEGSSPYYAKRVIGVGGDSVRCCTDSGALEVNEQELDEPYLAPGEDAGSTAFDVEVPEGRIFVLGDNRDDSTDSRHLLGAPGGGMIPVDRVVGEASRIVWPLPRSGQV